jgi:N-acetyl-alpha-D-muramate 1-phosphate uridylyltransferase
MCPVDGRPLVDHALDRLRIVTDDLAVNAHETQPMLRDHLDRRVHVSVESGPRLGTAGALGAMRSWIDGRAVVVVNGDTWCPGGTAELLRGWDGETIRVLVPGTSRVAEPFGPTSPVAGAAIPWSDVRTLESVPSGLWEVLWGEANAQGRLETVAHAGPFVDCAGPAEYLAANLRAAGGSAVGEGAVVEGVIEECVVWAGARVLASEHLVRAIRTDRGRTVLVRA